MSYYVNLLFKNRKDVNFSSILSKFRNEYPGCHVYSENEKDVSIAIDGIEGYICLFKNRSDKNTEKWGYIRLSWGCIINENMEKLIEITEKVGCMIYDDSQKILLDRTTMENMKKSFENGFSSVSDFVGKDILKKDHAREASL
jgi:hypothetical protein